MHLDGDEEPTADDIFARTFAELSNDGGVEIGDEGESTQEELKPEPKPAAQEGQPQTEQKPAAQEGQVAPEGQEGLPDPAAVAAAATEAAKKPADQQQPQPKVETKDDKPIADVLRALLDERQQHSKTETKPEPKPEPYKVPDYTAEQKAIVDAYEKEFPEMARAEQIIRSREYNAVTSYIFSQIGGVMETQAQRIQQLEGMLGNMVGHQQQTTIEAQIGGSLADHKPKIEAWIKEQPDFIRPAYEKIAKEGTAAEVIGMVKEWQKASGIVPAPQPQAGQVAIQPGQQPQPKSKPKVPAGLRPVPSVRTQPQDTTIARDDFDGAFDAFSQRA